MEKLGTQTLPLSQTRAAEWAKQGALVVGASLFVALCARVTIPLPFTPVPLTLQNCGVLIVGLLLGRRRGVAAPALYLAEGAAGIAQLLGPTGGFLMAYPVVAFVSGLVSERARKSFTNAAAASVTGEMVLFAGGLGWLTIWTGSLQTAFKFGLYGFVFAEVIKVLLAAGVASRFRAAVKRQA